MLYLILSEFALSLAILLRMPACIIAGPTAVDLGGDLDPVAGAVIALRIHKHSSVLPMKFFKHDTYQSPAVIESQKYMRNSRLHRR